MGSGRTIIVGAGGFGREVASWAEDCHQAGLAPPIAGFIDDKTDALKGFACPYEVVSSITSYTPLPKDQLLLAIGHPDTKRRIVETLVARGGNFASMIHPRAVVAGSGSIAEGAVICPLSLISTDVAIGRFCTINVLSSVGHDVRLGDYSTLSAHVDLTGGVQVGPGVMFGSGARVLPRVVIGEGAIVGAGSTVYRSVTAGSSVFAAPAKILKAAK